MFVRPTSYLTPQSCEYHSGHSYYPYHDAPRFTAPSYPSQAYFFQQPSAEEFEEHEYRRALEVIANHHRRQAAKETAIRRQQLVEATRQQYFTALAAEVEQQRQEQLLAARHSEFIRSRQDRARLAAAERQHGPGAFLRELRRGRPIGRQPHVVERRPFVDTLKQRLATESDAGIAEVIRNILSSAESHPVQAEKSKDSNKDAAEIVEDLLSSIFPGVEFRAQPQPTPKTEQDLPSVSDKGKGKARAVHFEESLRPAPTSEHVDEAFADILRRVMEVSKGTPSPRSPDEAGPSGSPPSSSPAAQPTVADKEQARIDREISLSSIDRVQNTLTKLQTGFVLPTELDHYAASSNDRDEITSVSSVSSSDLTKLIPYTGTNKPVYKYENELNGLLEELDKIDSHGDEEVREKRKGVVKAVEKALAAVERVVGKVIEKRLSFISTTISAAEVPLRGFDVDEGITEEVAPARGPAEIPTVVDKTTVPTPDQVEAVGVTSVEVSSQANETPPRPVPFVTEATTSTCSEPTSTQPDTEAPTMTTTPASVTEAKPEASQLQAQDEAPEAVGTSLLPEPVSPPSPVKEPREIDIDSNDKVLVFDSDTEKSDWSELEEH